MKKTKKIEISISNENVELLKKMGLTPSDVFLHGFEMILRQKYREVSMIDDDDEEELEIFDLQDISRQLQDIDEFLVSENNIANN